MSASIQLNKLDLVVQWKYACTNTECICNRQLHLPTLNEIENKNINTNNVVFGECGHGMHKACLDSYLKTYDGICPIDRLKWVQMQTREKPKYNIVN